MLGYSRSPAELAVQTVAAQRPGPLPPLVARALEPAWVAALAVDSGGCVDQLEHTRFRASVGGLVVELTGTFATPSAGLAAAAKIAVLSSAVAQSSAKFHVTKAFEALMNGAF